MEEFILIMKYIEQKNVQKPQIQMENSLPSIKNTSRSREHMKSMKSSTLSNGQASIYDIDKMKYGALLPKTGVYFLPDDRIVVFLKIMDSMRKKYEKTGDYMMSN